MISGLRPTAKHVVTYLCKKFSFRLQNVRERADQALLMFSLAKSVKKVGVDATAKREGVHGTGSLRTATAKHVKKLSGVLDQGISTKGLKTLEKD